MPALRGKRYNIKLNSKGVDLEYRPGEDIFTFPDELESGKTNTEIAQEKLDEVVYAINDLQEEFDENDSGIETVARDSIGETAAYILEWFGIPIDAEEAIRERDW